MSSLNIFVSNQSLNSQRQWLPSSYASTDVSESMERCQSTSLNVHFCVCRLNCHKFYRSLLHIIHSANLSRNVELSYARNASQAYQLLKRYAVYYSITPNKHYQCESAELPPENVLKRYRITLSYFDLDGNKVLIASPRELNQALYLMRFKSYRRRIVATVEHIVRERTKAQSENIVIHFKRPCVIVP